MKYSKTLDLLLAAVQFHQKGSFEKAAHCLAAAATSKDIAPLCASLDKANQAAFDRMKAEAAAAKKEVAKETAGTRTTALAKHLAEAAAKKKKAPPAFLKNAKKKKKAKADFGEDDFNGVLDDMTEEADGDDLVLEDLEDTMLDGDGDGSIEGVEEMPVASEDGDGDGGDLDGEGVVDLDFLGDEEVVEAEADDDEDDEKEDDKDEEEEAPAKEESKSKTVAKPQAKAVTNAKRATANLNAIDRLDQAQKRK